MATPTFRIRDALPSPPNTDALFIGAAFDSCIPHLVSIGSASQWGTQPFSTARPGSLSKLTGAIDEAASYRETGEGSTVRVLIIEAKKEGKEGEGEGGWIPVGSSTLRANYFPKYILDQKSLEEAIKGFSTMGVGKENGAGKEGREGEEFMMLEVLVTDFREETKAYRRGAGAALVKHAKGWAEELGMGVMFVDCWAGNEGRLVRYVFSFGLVPVVKRMC